MPIVDYEALIRYAEDGDQYTVWFFGHDRHGNPIQQRENSKQGGAIEFRPEWLTRIVDAGLIGGHMECPPHPPPNKILWAYIDDEYNLVSFQTFND